MSEPEKVLGISWTCWRRRYYRKEFFPVSGITWTFTLQKFATHGGRQSWNTKALGNTSLASHTVYSKAILRSALPKTVLDGGRKPPALQVVVAAFGDEFIIVEPGGFQLKLSLYDGGGFQLNTFPCFTAISILDGSNHVYQTPLKSNLRLRTAELSIPSRSRDFVPLQICWVQGFWLGWWGLWARCDMWNPRTWRNPRPRTFRKGQPSNRSGFEERRMRNGDR